MASNSNQTAKKKTATKSKALEKALISLEDPSVERRLEKFARSMVLPGESTPMIMPSPVPGKCGVARFPLTVTSKTLGDFSVFCDPQSRFPLQVSRDTPVPYDNSFFFGEAKFDGSSALPTYMNMSHDDVYVRPLKYDGEIGLPLIGSASLTITVRLNWRPSNYNSSTTFNIDGFTGSSWANISTTAGIGNSRPTDSTNISYPAGTYQAFRISQGPNPMGGTVSYEISISGPGTWSPSPNAAAENIYNRYVPEVDSVFEASTEWRVVAMDCLVTYSGATLDNAGVIAACNADPYLVQDETMYDAILKRPFDKYEGRLASIGDTPGGAHWHYVPTNLDALKLRGKFAPISDVNGYVGISGRTANEAVKITINLVVNFFTTDPSFNMKVQPDYLGFSELIEFLRRGDVPLVTSNDGHFEKIRKLAKRAASNAAQHVMNNPDQVIRVLKLLGSALV